MQQITIGQKAICTRLNGDKFNVRVHNIGKDDESELFYIVKRYFQNKYGLYIYTI